MWQATFFAAFAGSALAWFILFLIALAVLLWFISWLLFPSEEVVTVSKTLENLTGLDDRMASRLATFGIRSDRELMRLTPRGQQELQSQLGLHNGEYDRWRREILARWRNQYLPVAYRDIKEITPNPELGGVYTKRPRECDDLTKLTGVDKVTANRLNNAGIYTYEQFRLMMPEQRACVKRKFNLTFDFDEMPEYGVTAQWLAFMTDGEAAGKQGNPPVQRQPESGDPQIVATSFASSKAIKSASEDTEQLETRQSNGPTNAPSTSGSTETTSQPVIPTTRIDAELGRLYSAPPPHRDDLTKLNGIDRSAAARLNAAGIYTVAQIQSLSLSQRNRFQSQFNLPNFNFSQWVGSQESETSTNTPSPASSPTEMSQHPDLGFVYLSEPVNKDDLSKISGITAPIAKRMNEAGIYTFDQLESMTETQRGNFRTRFELPNFRFIPRDIDSIRRQDSPQQANAPHISSDYVSSTRSKTVVGFATSGTEELETRTTEDPLSHGQTPQSTTTNFTQTSEPKDRDEQSPLGFIYAARPENADELEKLPHIDAATAKRLNDAGIYTFEQLNSMSLSQQTQLRNRFGLEQVNFADWRRLIFAWSRGVTTSVDSGAKPDRAGWLHSVRLPIVAPGVFDGQQLVAYPEQVIFRGNDPEPWGTTVPRSKTNAVQSVAASDIRTDVNYVRIRRIDTRESVVTGITKSQLFEPGDETSGGGWNGLCERFFGARHLGVFAGQIPKEVETKFGLGGWGFGHQYDGDEEQEHCWAGRLIPPTVFEISVGRIGPATGTVVFRSNDPTIWNRQVQDSADNWAMPVANVSHPVSYVRIMRTDTGQAVIAKSDLANVTRRSEIPNFGWNGLNDHFFGGYHLGIYLQSAPQDVEIAYGEGGWGFGHPFDDNDRQAYGWDGREIPKTVFEISLLEHIPDPLRAELIA